MERAQSSHRVPPMSTRKRPRPTNKASYQDTLAKMWSEAQAHAQPQTTQHNTELEKLASPKTPPERRRNNRMGQQDLCAVGGLPCTSLREGQAAAKTVECPTGAQGPLSPMSAHLPAECSVWLSCGRVRRHPEVCPPRPWSVRKCHTQLRLLWRWQPRGVAGPRSTRPRSSTRISPRARRPRSDRTGRGSCLTCAAHLGDPPQLTRKQKAEARGTKRVGTADRGGACLH